MDASRAFLPQGLRVRTAAAAMARSVSISGAWIMQLCLNGRIAPDENIIWAMTERDTLEYDVAIVGATHRPS
jgi:hypothetical protein